jgi:hypothetical protein
MIAEYERDLIQQYEQEAARKLSKNGSRDNSGAVVNASAEIANRVSAARRGLESELELSATLLLVERGQSVTSREIRYISRFLQARFRI